MLLDQLDLWTSLSFVYVNVILDVFLGIKLFSSQYFLWLSTILAIFNLQVKLSAEQTALINRLLTANPNQ